MLSSKAVKEFKEIFCKEFNVELSDSSAREWAEKFLDFANMAYRPIMKSWAKKQKENDSANLE